MLANPFRIVENDQWQPVLDCLQTICNCFLPAQGSISNLFQTVLPLDYGLMLPLQKPSHPYFSPLVELPIVGLAHPFGKLLQEEFCLLHADWRFALCAAQVRGIITIINCIIIIVGNFLQWRQVDNPCDVYSLQFRRRLESVY